MWDRRAEYLSNYDGDTVKVTLDQGFGDTKTIDVRLFGVYAPEIREPGGIECRDFLNSWFKSQSILTVSRWSFIVTTALMKVADREQKSLDRYLGTITSLSGTRNLNLEIMQFIVSKGYGGGTGS